MNVKNVQDPNGDILSNDSIVKILEVVKETNRDLTDRSWITPVNNTHNTHDKRQDEEFKPKLSI